MIKEAWKQNFQAFFLPYKNKAVLLHRFFKLIV